MVSCRQVVILQMSSGHFRPSTSTEAADGSPCICLVDQAQLSQNMGQRAKQQFSLIPLRVAFGLSATNLWTA